MSAFISMNSESRELATVISKVREKPPERTNRSEPKMQTIGDVSLCLDLTLSFCIPSTPYRSGFVGLMQGTISVEQIHLTARIPFTQHKIH